MHGLLCLASNITIHVMIILTHISLILILILILLLNLLNPDEVRQLPTVQPMFGLPFSFGTQQ